MSQDKPCWEDGESPDSEVDVNSANFSEQVQRGQTVAHCLPGRFSATKQSSISNDFGLSISEVCNDEISVVVLVDFHQDTSRQYSQEKIVDLESDRVHYINTESCAKARARPVVYRLLHPESCGQDGDP